MRNDPLRDEIERLAVGIAALRTVYGLIRGNRMSRLTDKIAQAAGVAKRVSDRIEARADMIIARETEIAQRTEDVFEPHEAVLSQAEAGLDAAEQALRLMSNAPLERSGDSPKAPGGGLPQVQPFPPADTKAQGSGT